MEGIHGVDISWLHHSRGPRAPPSLHQRQSSQPEKRSTSPPSGNAVSNGFVAEKPISNGVNGVQSGTEKSYAIPAHHETNHIHLSRPHLTTRRSSEKVESVMGTTRARSPKESSKTPPQSPGLSRKSSWMSNLTSKFSPSSPQTNQPLVSPPGKVPQQAQGQSGTSPNGAKSEGAALGASPKSSGAGFLSSALRRFSSSTGSQPSKVVPTGGICPRKVLNVDQHRERCCISELHPAKLRRVAFCVDVEIAAPPKYKEEDSDEAITAATPAKGRKLSGGAADKEKKSKAKTKERSEGEALKNPDAVAEKKEEVKQSTRNESDQARISAVDEAVSQASQNSKPIPISKDTPKIGSKDPETLLESQISRPKSPRKSSPVHRDFGPNGMFEVDDWDLPVEKPKPRERKGSTGGAVHHDFGRNGMFEIPSSEDEGPKKPKNISPKSVATKIGKVSSGNMFSQEDMFEIPELQDPGIREQVVDEIQKLSEAESAPASAIATAKVETPQAGQPVDDAAAAAQLPGDVEPPREMTRKKEKKKRSEEERKERKEKKRQAAIENGTMPVELTGDDAATQTSNKPKPQSRPTTDPLRIYKRCCQLRETTPLQLVVDQLSATNACDPLNPAVVISLDLTNNSLQLEDIVTLGDWLAVVPVQKLILENCGLTDEAVRIILAGLLAAKTTEQAKHNKHLAKKPNKEKKERMGVISKLSLKNNKLIGRHGWMHIAFFLNMSQSLKAIDLSMVPFPRPPPTPSKASSAGERSGNSRNSSMESIPSDPMDLFWKCMAERVSTDALEEVVVGDCEFSTEHIEKLVDAVIACKVSRLGVAHNNLDTRAYAAIARYLNDKACMGLDLGGNKFSSPEDLQSILNAIDSTDNQMYAISLADCDLKVSDIKSILPILARLPNFKFVDFSHNHQLFESSPNALSAFSKWLPQMKMLKRLGLNDVALSSEHAISLAEILPEIPLLAHLSIQENPALTALADAKDEASQEEACALYASLMAATRVSKTIVCIDVDVPSKTNSEVVKALAKQVVAYSLRNMERSEHFKAAAALIADPHGGEQAVAVPDVLLHLVGHVDDLEDSEDEGPAPDEDYLVGGTGVVKALSVVLGSQKRDSRRVSREVTPMASGTNSPRLKPNAKGQARDVSRNLLESARKIRQRLQPALVRATVDAPEGESSKRLNYLDGTLARTIERFEAEYPECRQIPARPRATTATSETPGMAPGSFTNPFDATHEAIHSEADLAGDEGLGSLRRASRHGSDVSLASREILNEEGRLHRFSQRIRRELLPPTYTLDHHWGTKGDSVEPVHIEQLRRQLESKSGEEIRAEVEDKGFEQVIEDYRMTAQSLKDLEKSDPATWQKCKYAGMVTENGDVATVLPKGFSSEGDVAAKDNEGQNVEIRNDLTNGV